VKLHRKTGPKKKGDHGLQGKKKTNRQKVRTQGGRIVERRASEGHHKEQGRNFLCQLMRVREVGAAENSHATTHHSQGLEPIQTAPMRQQKYKPSSAGEKTSDSNPGTWS